MEKKQIYRLDGKNCFVEAMNNCFSIGKVLLNFCAYDTTQEKGNRLTKSIPIYISFDEWDYLAHEVYGKEFQGYSILGGMSSVKLAQKGKKRADGKALSRRLSLEKGQKKPWILKAEVGPGEEMGTGLIKPAGPADQSVVIGMDYKTLKMLLLTVNRHILSYETSCYANGIRR